MSSRLIKSISLPATSPLTTMQHPDGALGPLDFSSMEICWGAIGLVFSVSDRIALKFALRPASKRMQHEHHIYDLLERRPQCPNIVRSFLRLPDLNFMENMAGGNLEARLRSRQIRDEHDFVSVASLEPATLVSRWTAELASAAAWLESLGLAHGDIRPMNILLDSTDHLKLADFDCAAEIGTEEPRGCGTPYGRLQGSEAGKDKWTFGLIGPQTEQFAIGSVIYYLTRGHEPYEGTSVSRSQRVTLLQEKHFPATDTNNTRDAVIRKCWHGDYSSIQQLSIEVESLRLAQMEDYNEEPLEARRQECLEWVDKWKKSLEDLRVEWSFPTDEE